MTPIEKVGLATSPLLDSTNALAGIVATIVSCAEMS